MERGAKNLKERGQQLRLNKSTTPGKRVLDQKVRNWLTGNRNWGHDWEGLATKQQNRDGESERWKISRWWARMKAAEVIEWGFRVFRIGWAWTICRKMGCPTVKEWLAQHAKIAWFQLSFGLIQQPHSVFTKMSCCMWFRSEPPPTNIKSCDPTSKIAIFSTMLSRLRSYLRLKGRE